MMYLRAGQFSRFGLPFLRCIKEDAVINYVAVIVKCIHIIYGQNSFLSYYHHHLNGYHMSVFVHLFIHFLKFV